jgi:hypothetical protein
MSFNISYTGDAVTDDRRACADILAWYGPGAKGRRLYRLLVRFVQFGFDDVDMVCAPSIERLEMMLSISGVRGYPVQAFWKRYAR